MNDSVLQKWEKSVLQIKIHTILSSYAAVVRVGILVVVVPTSVRVYSFHTFIGSHTEIFYHSTHIHGGFAISK